eukprot:CAMPEP_0183343454 /NCGR_PEP_ID=MMETSP0164_2-20130417/9369_1 /TAXON_ID=221442 /ORGANISM="Coccolithus pelagicus ssp braarudi, Strain PLY182g" /LENGTH=191 /DNA_ID=CAMNT_0025514283 /DNA_START=26 /DNA_END=601 /DNA_ORIENTATION=-
MSSVLARASRALRTVPSRSGALRRMCTAAVEEAAPAGKLSYSSPEFVTFGSFFGLMYLSAFRWAVNDKKLEAKKAAIQAAKAEHVAEVSAVVEAVVAAPEAVAAIPVVVVAPVAPAGAAVSEWKVADVASWLKSLELDEFSPTFKTHSVDGKLLLTLDEQDMYKVLNITSPLHRKKIMMAIAELRAGYLNP